MTIFFGHAHSSSKSRQTHRAPGAHDLCTIGAEHSEISSRSLKPCTRASQKPKRKPPSTTDIWSRARKYEVVPEAASSRELTRRQGPLFICPQPRKAAGTFTEVSHIKHWMEPCSQSPERRSWQRSLPAPSFSKTTRAFGSMARVDRSITFLTFFHG